MSQSFACARAVVAQLVAEGVGEFVLAPGSRSAPLALAASAQQAAGRLRLHVRVDERSAGFLALGLAKASGRVVAVVTTSGTAVGNLLPAVMESHHARVPLVVVSADRPAELVGTGANQTTVQPGIFGSFVRADLAIDAAGDPSLWARRTADAATAAAANGYPGPVHLNVALPEPLIPDQGVTLAELAVSASGCSADPAAADAPLTLDQDLRTVVVAGDASIADGARAREFAEVAGWPLLAEPSSNARGGPNALRGGRLLLNTGLAEAIERVVMFGHPTLSRPVTRLLTRPDVELIVVGSGPGLPNPGRQAAVFAPAVTCAHGSERGRAWDSWLSEWLTADRMCSRRIDQLLAALPYLSGPVVANAVLVSLGAGLLVLGNSMAIRDADLAPIGDRAGQVFANRGLSGIDGTVSTAVGLALAAGRPATLLCGDLSFVHDTNGLVIGPGEPRPDLRVVVADDSGGSIFATLEYGEPRFSGCFERVFATPSGVDPVALAVGCGLQARRVSGIEELVAALAEPVRGLEVLVVGVDRAHRRELAAELEKCARFETM